MNNGNKYNTENNDWKMKKINRLSNRLKKEKLIKSVAVAFSTILLFAAVLLVKENMSLKSAMEEKNEIIKDKEAEIEKKDTIINEKDASIEILTNTIRSMDEEILDVKEVNESYVDELNELRSRKELYDKYQYAIFDEDGKRTELTYEEIKLGEEIMLDNNLDPDIMFGTIMVESNGNPKAVNTDTNATGYGQFLDSTAEWVWTELLGHDNYASNVRKDGKANIQMMGAYYGYLYGQKGNTFDVMKAYSGNSTNSGATKYIDRVNHHINRAKRREK